MWPTLQTVFQKTKKPAASKELLVETLRNEIDKTKTLCKYSTTKNKNTAVNVFEHFINEVLHSTITIHNVDADHIKAFELWALKSNKPSTVALHMRCLRSIFNRINGSGTELFKHVRTGNCQTEKRAVSEETINKLAKLSLRKHSPVAMARDIFLMCFYGMGIPLIDVVYMKKSQYKNGFITYFRQKTHHKVKVKVSPQLEKIIKSVSSDSSPYLLPILDSDDEEVKHKQYRRFYQQYSRNLSKLSMLLGKDVHLTSYVARHSWASIAYKKGVNINLIAQALGHANTNITYAYIKEIDDSLLNDANMIVLRAVQ